MNDENSSSCLKPGEMFGLVSGGRSELRALPVNWSDPGHYYIPLIHVNPARSSLMRTFLQLKPPSPHAHVYFVFYISSLQQLKLPSSMYILNLWDCVRAPTGDCLSVCVALLPPCGEDRRWHRGLCWWSVKWLIRFDYQCAKYFFSTELQQHTHPLQLPLLLLWTDNNNHWRPVALAALIFISGGRFVSHQSVQL